MLPANSIKAMLICLALTLGALPACAQQSNEPSAAELLQKNRPQLFAIMSSVARPDGHLDVETHQRFWALIPPSVRNNPDSFVEGLDLTNTSMYQRELWESIRLSARAGKAVKSVGYDLSLSKVAGNKFSSPDAAQRAEEMILAAASGEPLETSIGTLHLTEQEANRVLDGLNGSIKRVRALLNPAWDARNEHL